MENGDPFGRMERHKGFEKLLKHPKNGGQVFWGKKNWSLISANFSMPNMVTFNVRNCRFAGFAAILEKCRNTLAVLLGTGRDWPLRCRNTIHRFTKPLDEVASGWISSVRSWLSLPADGTLPSGGPLISWLPVELLTFDQPEVATFHFQTLSPGPFVYHHSSLTWRVLVSWERNLLGDQTSGTDVKSISHESHHHVKFIRCFYLVKVMTLYDIRHPEPRRNFLVSHFWLQVVTKVWSSLQQDLVPTSAKFTWRIDIGVLEEAWGSGCLPWLVPLTHTLGCRALMLMERAVIGHFIISIPSIRLFPSWGH